MLRQRLRIEVLPITTAFRRRKRLLQPRGELALIEDGPIFNHLGYFSLRSGPGFFRGGHYHRRKQENFYVIKGRLRIELADPESGVRDELIVEGGTRVSIPPGCAHRFVALEESEVIEYYEGMYDPDDDIPYERF